MKKNHLEISSISLFFKRIHFALVHTCFNTCFSANDSKMLIEVFIEVAYLLVSIQVHYE